MKFNKVVKENVENKNGFLVACVCSILLLLTLCYFGVNSSFRGTSAVVTDTFHCLNGRVEMTYNSQTVCCPTGYEEIKNINGELYCVNTSKEAKVTYTGTASDEDNETPDDETVCGQIYGSNWYVYVADDWKPYANTALDSKEGSCGYHCGAWTGGTADCYKVCKFCYSTEHTVEYPIDTEKGDYCFRYNSSDDNSSDVYYFGTFSDYDYDAGWDNFDKYTHIEEYDGDENEEACLSNNTYEVKFNYNYADDHTTEPVTDTYKFASPHGFYSDLTKTVVIKEYEISGVTIEKSINNKNYLLELAGWQFEYTDSDINEYAQYSLDDKKTWEKITFSTGPVKATNVENYTWFKMLRKRYADEYAIINAIWEDLTITLPVAKSGVKECFWKIDDGSNDIKYVSSGGKYVVPNNSTNTISITPDCSTTGRFTASFYEDGELTSSKMCIKKWKEETCPSNENCETTLGGYYSCDAGAITSPDSSKKWYTSETCSGTAVTFSTYSLTGDRSFYSCSSGSQPANNYTVTFDAGDGSVSPTTKTVTAGSTYGELPTPSYDNHSFDGWYTKESGGDKITADSIVPTYNHTLFAHWTSLTATTGSTCLNSVAEIGKTGWTRGSCNEVIKDDTYHIWDEINSCCLVKYKYQLDFVYNGGDKLASEQEFAVVGYDGDANGYVYAKNPTKTFKVNINNKASATLSANSASASQTFEGWTYSNGTSSTAKYGTSSTNITTKWSDSNKKVTAQYFDDLRNSSGTVTLTANWISTKVTLPTVTKTGYTCGYTDSENSTIIKYSSNGTYDPSITTSSVTLYTVCVANTGVDEETFTATFNKNGGTLNGNENASCSTTTGKCSITDLPTASKTGYTFKGWGTSSACSSGTTTSISLTGNATYYACWSANAYTVVYDGNGSTSGSTNTSNHTYGTSKTLNKNGYVKTGYTFVNWNTKKDGSGDTYSDEENVLNLLSTNGGKVTLYAQWRSNTSGGGETPTEKTFTATFDANGGTLDENDNKKSCKTTSDECEVTDLPTATRDGYTFKGWGAGKTCTDGEEDKLTLDANKTYYACWSKNDTGTAPNPDVDGEGNVNDNVQTGDIAMAFVIFIGMFALGYAVYYFRNLKQN